MLIYQEDRRCLAANRACRVLLAMGANVRPAPSGRYGTHGHDHTPDLGPFAVVWRTYADDAPWR